MPTSYEYKNTLKPQCFEGARKIGRPKCVAASQKLENDFRK
jgi:hypothetical protein